VTSDEQAKVENRGEFRISIFEFRLLLACHSSLVTRHFFSALLGRDREERAKLLLNFPAFAFGAGDSLLVVLSHG
jgi:hypothetical protein